LFGIGCYVGHDELIAGVYVEHFANFQGCNHLAGAKSSNGAVGGLYEAEMMRRKGINHGRKPIH